MTVYHLFTQQSDGVWINRETFATVREAKVNADQYWPHANCQVQIITHGSGKIVTSRTATGTWE